MREGDGQVRKAQSVEEASTQALVDVRMIRAVSNPGKVRGQCCRRQSFQRLLRKALRPCKAVPMPVSDRAPHEDGSRSKGF